jgi:2-polyprenyl-3-methyl-5-hydroxy-6-metoxy-1,4-benzoquinol methylase
MTVKTIRWTPELVEKFWSGVAQTRLAELSFSRHNSDYLIELIQGHLKSDGRHLDFGAGDGDLLKALIRKGYATAAYEPVGARAARFPADVTGHPKYLGQVQAVGSERFDVVLMIEVIEHILEPDLPAVLRRVKSLLAGDGTLIVTTPNAEDLELSAAYCPQCETLFHRWQHQRSFTLESLPKFLGQHGFECVHIREVDFSYTRYFIEDLKYLNEEIEVMRRREQRSLLARLRRFLTGQRIAERAHPPRFLRADPATLLCIGRQIKGG